MEDFFTLIPTPLSIGDRNPCVDGLSGRSGGDDTDSDTEISSRQSSAVDRLRRRIQRACSFKHREHLASEYDFCGDTDVDTVSHIPTRSSQSLKEPLCGRAFDQTEYSGWKPW
jgi:hypothetical protein